MKKRIIIFLVAIVMTSFLTISANARTFTFADHNFYDTDWTLITQELGNGGNIVATHVPPFLPPSIVNNFRSITNSVNAGAGSSVWGFHLKNSAIYYPTTQGAIEFIEYSERSIMFSGFGEGQATGPALLQKGKQYFSYYPNTGGFFANTSDWTNKTFFPMVQLHFWTLSDPNDHPDFSSTAAPITFGFFRANSNGPNDFAYSIIAGIDDWSVSVNTIPEPSTILLLGSGLMGLAGVRRKLQKRTRNGFLPLQCFVLI